MPIQYQTKYKTLIIECEHCNTTHSTTLKNLKINFLSEVKEYENILISCPFCHTFTIININIPELDEMELEVMEELATPQEVQQRQEIRALMWDIRPDLKTISKTQYRDDYIKKNKEQIKKIRAEIRKRKKRERINL